MLPKVVKQNGAHELVKNMYVVIVSQRYYIDNNNNNNNNNNNYNNNNNNRVKIINILYLVNI